MFIFKFIIVIITVVFAYYYFFGGPDIPMPEYKKDAIDRVNGANIIDGGNENVNAVYMVYGLSTNVGAGEGMLSIIPIGTAKQLLSKFPNMDKCSGKGSFAAKRAVIDANFYYGSPLVSSSIENLKSVFKNSTYRICVHITGISHGKPETDMNGNPHYSFGAKNETSITIQSIRQVSCNQ